MLTLNKLFIIISIYYYYYRKCISKEKKDNSVLLFLANTFSSLNQISVYADLPSFMSPSLITGDSLRPDLLLLTGNKVLYILELTLGFETNIQANSVRKANKYTPLLQDLSSFYNKIIFINVSMGALGVIGSSCDSFLSLLQDLSFDKVTQRRIIMITINIAIRSTHYIFCQRNKPWNNPELLNFRTFTSFSCHYTFELCYMSIIIAIIFHVLGTN